jgi:PAS domain S-box-containing protein
LLPEARGGGNGRPLHGLGDTYLRPKDLGIDKLFWRIRDAVIVADARTQRIVLWNPTATNIFGYSASEALKLRVEALVPERLKAQHREGMARYLQTGHGPYIDSYVPLELPALRKSGEEIYIELSLSPIEPMNEADGDGRFVLAIVRDITERKQAGEALKANEERFRHLVQGVKDYAIFMLDLEGRVASWNEGAHRIKGYKQEEIMGCHFSVFFTEEAAKRGTPEEALRIAAATGTYEEEGWRVRKDGTTFWASVLITALRDEEGNLRGFSKVTRDATERKEADDKLQRSFDALLTIHEAGQLFGSTLNEDEIGRSLLEMARHVAGLEAAVIRLEEHPWHAVGAEGLWRLANGSSEARAACREVLMTGEHRLFELPRPDSGRGRLVGLCLPMPEREQITRVLEAYGPEALREWATVEMLGSLANQAANALENARLYRELGERESRLQELVGKLMAAQEEERRRVAYDVHDGLAQVAMGAHQQLQAFFHDHLPSCSAEARRRLDRALELVEQTTVEAQRVIADLRPTTLDDFGLAAAIRSQVGELRAQGWDVSYDEALGEERLPAEMETALYRVAQEALWNVRKHAGITRVVVALERRGEKIRLEVHDWGRGFETSAVSEDGGPGERVGLSSMRERIALLGGDFEIHSQPGSGTSVVAEVPLAAPNGGDTGHAG